MTYDRAKLLNAIDTHNLETDRRVTIEKLAEVVLAGAGAEVLEGCKAAPSTGYAEAQKRMVENFSTMETLAQQADKAAYVIVNINESHDPSEENFVKLQFNDHSINVVRGKPVKLSRGFYHALKDAVYLQPSFTNADGKDDVTAHGVYVREIPRFPYQILGVA